MSVPHRTSPTFRTIVGTTCLTAVAAGIAAVQPTPAFAQLPSLGTLASDLTALTTTVNDQGVKITANTAAVNTLTTSLNGVTSTVAAQASTLQSVQTAVTAQAASLATVTTRIGQQDALITANVSGLTTLTDTVGTLSGTVTARAADLATLTTTVGQQGTQVTLNTGALDTLTGDLATLTGTVADQGTAIQTVRTAVDANVAGLAALSTTVGQQGAKVVLNTGAIATLGDTVDTLTGSLGDLANSVDDQGATLRTVRAAVDANVAGLATLSATVDRQGGQTDTNTGDIAALTGSVGTLATTLAGTGTQVVRNTGDIADLRTRVDVGAGDIAGLRVVLGATGSDVAQLQGQVADHEIRITGNTTDIAALTATVGVQGGRIVRQGADLDTANANIASLQSSLASQGGTLDRIGTTVADQGTQIGQQGTQIADNTAAILSLRNMAVSGNASPVQFVTPEAPLVASATATNDVAILGAQAGPVRLHNVADGDIAAGSTEAVNGGQLNDTNVALGTLAGTVTGLSGIVTTQARDITGLQGQVGDLGTTATTQASLIGVQGTQITATIGALDTLRGEAERGAIGPLRYSTPALPTTPNGGTVTRDVTLVGVDPSAVRLHNVAGGDIADGSTDAVNGGQLFALSRSYRGLADLAVQYDDAGRTALTLGQGGAPVLLRNVLAGTLAAGSTDAVNGGQLFDTNQALATLSIRTDGIASLADRTADDLTDLADRVGNGAIGPVRYASAAEPTIANGIESQDLTLVGASDAPVGLHNVASGTIRVGSTDAINGGQLLDLGRAVSRTLGDGFGYDPLTGFTGSFSYGGESFGDIQSVLGAIEGSMSAPGEIGIDDGVQPKYFHANSVAADSTAAGVDSTAIGPASMSVGVGSVALGRNAMAGGDSSVAIGDGASAMNGKAVSIGLGNVASGDGAVAIGDPNYATGEGATALGKDNIAFGTGAIALGDVNEAQGDGAAAIGSMNKATGLGATAMGFTNAASGIGAIAIGSNNRAIGDGSLAIGLNVSTTATDTLAIGNNANASGTSSVAIGNRASANNDQASALGDDAVAGGFYSAAIGASSRASNVGATALGISSVSSGYASTAVGSGAIADKVGSVALGSATQTVRGAVIGYTAFGVTGAQVSQGEIAIARNLPYYDPATNSFTPTGDRQITGLAAGSADTDGVNVAQLRGVSGQLGTAFAGGLGSGARYDAATGSLVGPSYTLNGITYTNVGDALQALSTRPAGTGTDTGSPSGSGAVVSYDSPSGDTVTLAPGGTAIHNVAPGQIAAGSTDAVNGGQLAQTNAQLAATDAKVTQTGAEVAQLATTVANGATGPVRYADAGSVAPNGGTRTNDVTLVGADSGAAVTLHNVAGGQVAAGSTDAVNGTQLAATNTRVGAVETRTGATETRVGAVETRIATVESKADQALASNTRAVQYDGSGSVTLGNGSTPAALRNVASGTANTDAVNVGQLTTATNNAVAAAASYTDQRVAALSFDLARVDRNANAGTAGAMALAGMPQAFEEGRSMLAMSVGTFQGQSAVAMGLSRIGNDGHTVLKLGATYNSRKQVGANAGIGYQF